MNDTKPPTLLQHKPWIVGIVGAIAGWVGHELYTVWVIYDQTGINMIAENL